MSAAAMSILQKTIVSLASALGHLRLVLLLTLLGINAAGAADTVWVEDAVPIGAVQTGSAEGWNWVSLNPPPYSGTLAHQSALLAGTHQHYFYGATSTLSINTGDTLFTYIYLDPTNPPTEVMLQWHEAVNGWEHRAYWGANTIPWGVDGTVSLKYIGPLPTTGGWVRLNVPASSVGLEGITLDGMAYTLNDGLATWDQSGKSSAAAATQIYYIFADHLNTPRVITNTANTTVWRWDSDPFGTDVPNENPSGLGTFNYNLRFPGQYYDAETGLNYNSARDYDSSTGRYVESDPIGLRGGINTYAYTKGNPISFTDPLGLASMTPSSKWEAVVGGIEDLIGHSQKNKEYDEAMECKLARCTVDTPTSCGTGTTQVPGYNWLPAYPSPNALPPNCYCVTPQARPESNPWVSPNWGGSGGQDPPGMPPRVKW